MNKFRKKKLNSDNDKSYGLNFDEFFPREIPKYQKKKKRPYIELKMKKMI